ncbi:hypothetical protein QOZ80_7AG0571390 [Eleusine coracana subsp. coracana]|nr:hypothetical protein QOZ80_7AG0571390 [Eleusine coracana subsp. coracana]
MPRLFLFCLVSSQIAVNTVMARPFPVLSFDGGAIRSIAEAPSASGALHVHSLLEHKFAGSPLGSHHGSHSPFDRHFAGGKIIVGGLAAAIIVAVFCYIRITRTKKQAQVIEPKS